MIGQRGAQTPLVTPQYDCQEYYVTMESDGTISANGEGDSEVTTVKNTTGDYSISPKFIGRRVVGFSAFPFVANLSIQIVSNTDATNVVNFKLTNNSGTATDSKCMIRIVVAYDSMRRA